MVRKISSYKLINRTPFHNACKLGSSILVEKFISQVKDITMATKRGRTALSLAYAAWQNFEVRKSCHSICTNYDIVPKYQKNLAAHNSSIV